MMSVFKIAEIKTLLRQDQNLVVVPPDFDGHAELLLSGVPKDRVKSLLSVMATGERCFLIMPESQYNYYKREEDNLISKAGDTIGHTRDSRDADTEASE